MSSPFSHHHIKSTPESLPANLPVLNLNAEETGIGWREVPVGELVKTYYQVFVFQPRVEWRLSAYFTKDKYKNSGASNFRAPASLKAWITVLCMLPRKYWRKLTS